MNAAPGPMPRWLDLFGLPVINLLMALIVSGLIVLAIGANPFEAVGAMGIGAFGDLYGIGYTLYYATNFIFTGLAVAIAFHAGLFNIGGEGQAYIGGLGAGLVALLFDHSLSMWPIIARCPFGAFSAAQVRQLTGDRFENIDGRGDAFDLAIFIGDHREVRAGTLKLIQQLQDRDRIGNVQRRVQVALRIELAPVQGFAQVGERDHAEQIVELFARHQEPRMAAFLGPLPQHFDRLFYIQPDHILPRHHDRTDLAVGEC